MPCEPISRTVSLLVSLSGTSLGRGSDLSRRHQVLRAHGCRVIYADKASGEGMVGRPQLAKELAALEPGDCLMTGTPAGCGTFMVPPRFLEPGDVVTVSASGIGQLTNPVVQGTARTR